MVGIPVSFLGWPIFRCHVGFRECKLYVKQTNKNLSQNLSLFSSTGPGPRTQTGLAQSLMDFVRIFCWPPCSSWRQEGKLPFGKLTYQWNIPPCLIGNTPSKGPFSIANVSLPFVSQNAWNFFAPAFLGGQLPVATKRLQTQGSATTYGSLSLVTSKEMTWRASSRSRDLREPGPSNPPPQQQEESTNSTLIWPHIWKLTCQGGWVGWLIHLFSAFDRNGVCLCGGRTSFFLDRSYSSKNLKQKMVL